MKKTWIKALEVTLADNFSQGLDSLLFDVTSLFWVVRCYSISASVGHMKSFCMCVGNGDATNRFLQNCLWIPGYSKISNFGYLVFKDFQFRVSGIQRFPVSGIWYSKISSFGYLVFKDFQFRVSGIQRFPISGIWYSKISNFGYLVFKDFQFRVSGIQRFPVSGIWYSKISSFGYLVFKDFQFRVSGIQRFPISGIWYSKISSFGYLVFKDFQFRVSGSQNNPKRTALVQEGCRCTLLTLHHYDLLVSDGRFDWVFSTDPIWSV